MNTIILLSEKFRHENLFLNLKNNFPEYIWVLINNKEDFNVNNLIDLDPIKIFIPHWSYIIHKDIYNKFECVVFHMTDLPFGRGGSPLQNLITRGFIETKVSALKVEKGIDTGPIYLKQKLSLLGTAEEILFRVSIIIENMIIEIINKNFSPIPQIGAGTEFKRRRPKDGNVAELESIHQFYDYIRMLDAEDYPNAYLEFGEFRLEFSKANIESNKTILANVRIIKR